MARAVLRAVPAWVALSMEEIYAKFVSQKISKTRWRPLPPGSLQTAETFATGSWDNEVPLRPAGIPCQLLPGTAPPAVSARTRFLAPRAVLCLPNACLTLGRLIPESHQWPRFLCFWSPFARDAFKAGLIEGSAHFSFGEFDVYFISR